MEQFVEIRTMAVGGNEAYLRSCVGAFCVALDPTLDEINDVKTAVSEAVTNIIVHAYRKGGDKEIRLSARIKERRLYIDITDHGCGIHNIERARQAFYTTADADERSGLGFTVMETFMDFLEVRNNADGGVTVSMEKEFSGCSRILPHLEKGEACARAQ